MSHIQTRDQAAAGCLVVAIMAVVVMVGGWAWWLWGAK